MFKIVALLLGISTIAFAKGPGVPKGACDETKECTRYTFPLGAKAKCKGYYGCKGATFTNGEDALCTGAYGCKNGKFDGNNPKVLCGGMRSCNRASAPKGLGISGLNAVNLVECNGFNACQEIVGGISAPSVKCDGDIACTNYKSKRSTTRLNLESAFGPGSLVYCNGKGCCRNTVIDSDDKAYCDGDIGCRDSLIRAPIAECMGKRSCKDCDIKVGTLKAYGFLGASGASVTEPDFIKAYGFKALAFANILTRGKNTEIKAFGYAALAGATVDITSGSQAKIACKGKGCAGATITVSRNSALELTPLACDPCAAEYEASRQPDTGKKIAGTNCPKVIRQGRCPTTGEMPEQREFDQEELDFIEQVRQEIAEFDAEEDAKFDAYIDEMLSDYEDEIALDEEYEAEEAKEDALEFKNLLVSES